MLVIGLTGGIGMGKSSAALHFANRGVPVFSADACVHELYEGKAAPAIEAEFPGFVRGGKVDRKLLSERVSVWPKGLKKLEEIVHPMVVEAEIEFLREQEKKGEKLAVLEIPLLFETDARDRVDVTVVVSAPRHLQWRRVMMRPGMTAAKLEHLIARQLPDTKKRALADFVVDSGKTHKDMHAQIDKIIELLKDRDGRVMERLRAQ